MLFLIGEGDVALAFGLSAIWGWCWGGHFILESMMADVIDYDEFLTNERRDAAQTKLPEMLTN
jgi:Na+/melibiose symporter-like transporter